MRALFLALLASAGLIGVMWAGQYGYGPVVITNEYEFKIMLLLGAPWREPLTEPGLTWRIPVFETVDTLDKKLQYLDAEPVELLIGNQALLVDYYAVWRIVDPLAFMRSFGGRIDSAQAAIARRLKSQVAATIGKMALEELLARADVLNELDDELSFDLAQKGVAVVDVRINRTELPDEAETAAFDQMREQRRAISRYHRAKGDREAREIRAVAERKARTMLASAKAEAEITRGQGDAESAAIYSGAYGQAPQFYAFVRSLEAYRATMNPSTTLVLSPEHEFFKFLEPTKAMDGEAASSGSE
jgi:membrane protease subunit HflC